MLADRDPVVLMQESEKGHKQKRERIESRRKRKSINYTHIPLESEVMSETWKIFHFAFHVIVCMDDDASSYAVYSKDHANKNNIIAWQKHTYLCSHK